jgi:hypothetical protein
MRRENATKRIRARLRRQAESGRLCLLILVAVSLINQLLLAFGVPYHFLFSAAAPYYMNWCCVQLSPGGWWVALAVILTVGCYVAYAVCWLLSGRSREWMVAAVGLYGLDTLLLLIFSLTLLENPVSCLLELLVHGVCLVLLVRALMAAQRLSRMPKRTANNHKNRNEVDTYDEVQHHRRQAVAPVSAESAENGPV